MLLLNLLETIESSLPKENKNAVVDCGEKKKTIRGETLLSQRVNTRGVKIRPH